MGLQTRPHGSERLQSYPEPLSFGDSFSIAAQAPTDHVVLVVTDVPFTALAPARSVVPDASLCRVATGIDTHCACRVPILPEGDG